MGHHSANILIDGSADSSYYWTGSSSTGTVLSSNEKSHTGDGVLRCNLVSTSANTANAYLRQSLVLAGGKDYVFSGYINTSDITSFPNKNTGSYLAVYCGSTCVGKSEIINYNTSSDLNSGIDAIDSGWEKVSVSFNVPSSGSYSLAFEQLGAKGSSYCDDLQLEVYENIASSNKTAALTNYTSFGGFDNYNGDGILFDWSGNYYSLNSSSSPLHGPYCAYTTGSIGSTRELSQTVNINKPAKGLTFILSGWGKANSVGSAEKEPSSTAPYYGLIAEINYLGGGKETHYVSFNSDYADWQYASGIIVPKDTTNKTISTIVVKCAYNYNANNAYFDNISLLIEPAETYYYDDDGNLQSGANGNAEINCTYDSNTNLLQTYKTPSGITHNFTYDDDKLLETESFAGVTKTNTRSSVGKVTQEITTANDFDKYLQQQWSFHNCFTNADDSQFCTASTDVNGLTTNYLYFENYNNSNLPTRQLDFIRKPNGTEQHYTYYSNSDRTYQTYISGVSSVKYYYGEDNNTGNCSNEMLSSIRRKSFYTTPTGTTEFHQKYSIGYNDLFGNVASISVSGSNTGTDNSYSTEKKLIQKSYESGINNGRLATMTYPNGDAVSFGYDLFDRITSETYTTTNGSNMTIHNEYSSEGDLVKKYSQNQQGVTTEAYVYNYDSLGRLIHSREYNNGLFALQTSNYFDTSNRPKQQSWTDGTSTFSQALSYNGNNDMLGSINRTYKRGSVTYNVNTSYSYDALLRLTKKETTCGENTIKREYSYRDISNSNRTTAQLETMKYLNNINTVTVGAKYECNSAGNLYKVYPYDTFNNVYSSIAYQTYNYDPLGQLTSVNDYGAGYVYDYTYDTAGNIRKIIKDPYNSSNTTVIELSYNDTIWRDRLTSVKVGNTTGNIVYESVGNGFISGNPISYYNGRSYSFTWQNGRQLSTASVGNTNVSYSYDMSGLRSSKTVGSDTYYYDTINGQVVVQKCGAETLWFVYDDESKPYALIYQSGANAGTTIYFYALNLQGDVVALLNSFGNVVAKYQYDPWGAVTVTTYNSNPIGNINPLRYRGYYYDSETELYYLQSRYYDPAIGRFINADVFTTTDADGFLSCNMFAYCENDPVNRSDPTGELSEIAVCALVGGLVGAISGGITAYNTGSNILVGVASGLTTGVLCGLLPAEIFFAPIAFVVGAGIDAASQVLNNYLRGKWTSFKDLDKVSMSISGFSSVFSLGRQQMIKEMVDYETNKWTYAAVTLSFNSYVAVPTSGLQIYHSRNTQRSYLDLRWTAKNDAVLRGLVRERGYTK